MAFLSAATTGNERFKSQAPSCVNVTRGCGSLSLSARSGFIGVTGAWSLHDEDREVVIGRDEDLVTAALHAQELQVVGRIQTSDHGARLRRQVGDYVRVLQEEEGAIHQSA